MRSRKQTSVTSEEIQAAVLAVEADEAAGIISPRVAAWRVDRCRRARTARELSKASGGRVGSPRRADNPDQRRDGFLANVLDGLLALLGRH